MTPAPKVSVVVPAYRPGAGIERVARSMAAQTLPADEFEVVIVDDGSPDDTWQRLEAIRDASSNVRITRIENSGWASRPRNVGLEMARGEYVLFMDHDDEVTPDGLRSSYEYAAANRADVLSPKESKTSDPAWGIGNYTENVPNAIPTRGVNALLPMMPHKFYRREFLLEHGIRFPEGRRMLWEDVYFNVACFRHAKVISILSDVPVYLWHATDQNTSTTYGPHTEEFWLRIAQLLEFVTETLDGEEFRAARESVLAHQYRTRIIGRFDELLAQGPADAVPMALGQVRRILDTYVPEHLDARLPIVVRPRAFLLRHGRVDLLRSLRDADAGTAGIAAETDLRWEDGRLLLDVVARWTGGDGRPLTLDVRDGRLVRRVPAEVADVVPHDLLDVTDAVRRATCVLTLRDRFHHVTWALETTARAAVVPSSDGATASVEAHASAVVDLGVAGGGRPLTRSVWDVFARTTLLGVQNHRAVRSGAPAQAALVDGRSAIAYGNKGGKLSLDLHQRVRDVVGSGAPDVAAARVTRVGRGLRLLTVPLPGVHVHGTTRIEGRAALDGAGGYLARIAMSVRVARIRWLGPFLQRALGAKRAVLRGEGGTARLEALFRALPGRYHASLRFEDRTVASPLVVDVGLLGRVRVLVSGRGPGQD